jgi:uncharacterized protein (TIGR03067 family)
MHPRVTQFAAGILLLGAATLVWAGDADKLQGKWDVTKVLVGGVATENLKGVQAVFDKDKMSLVGEDGKREFKIKLDPSKKPKAIDLTALDGDCKDKTNPAIYQLEGDTLKLCLVNDPGNNKRPTEFSSPEGTSVLVMTFKRAK